MSFSVNVSASHRASRSALLLVLWLFSFAVIAEHRVAEHHLDPLHSSEQSLEVDCTICQFDASAKWLAPDNEAVVFTRDSLFSTQVTLTAYADQAQRCVAIRGPPLSTL